MARTLPSFTSNIFGNSRTSRSMVVVPPSSSILCFISAAIPSYSSSIQSSIPHLVLLARAMPWIPVNSPAKRVRGRSDSAAISSSVADRPIVRIAAFARAFMVERSANRSLTRTKPHRWTESSKSRRHSSSGRDARRASSSMSPTSSASSTACLRKPSRTSLAVRLAHTPLRQSYSSAASTIRRVRSTAGSWTDSPSNSAYMSKRRSASFTTGPACRLRMAAITETSGPTCFSISAASRFLTCLTRSRVTPNACPSSSSVLRVRAYRY